MDAAQYQARAGQHGRRCGDFGTAQRVAGDDYGLGFLLRPRSRSGGRQGRQQVGFLAQVLADPAGPAPSEGMTATQARRPMSVENSGPGWAACFVGPGDGPGGARRRPRSDVRCLGRQSEARQVLADGRLPGAHVVG